MEFLTIPPNTVPVLNIREHYVYSEKSAEDVLRQVSEIYDFAKETYENVIVTCRGDPQQNTHPKRFYYFGIYSITSVGSNFELVDHIFNYKQQRENKNA